MKLEYTVTRATQRKVRIIRHFFFTKTIIFIYLEPLKEKFILKFLISPLLPLNI